MTPWLSILVVCTGLDGRGLTCETRMLEWPTPGQCARYVIGEYMRAKLRGPFIVKDMDCKPSEEARA